MKLIRFKYTVFPAIFFLLSFTTQAQVTIDSTSQIFTKVELDASFPGGEQAWKKYLKKAIKPHMKELRRAGDEGTCRVQFLIDTSGSIMDVHALTLKGTTLATVVIEAIRNAPKWEPLKSNGRLKKSYMLQTISFTPYWHLLIGKAEPLRAL